jgi:hypothetical protein
MPYKNWLDDMIGKAVSGFNFFKEAAKRKSNVK